MKFFVGQQIRIKTKSRLRSTTSKLMKGMIGRIVSLDVNSAELSIEYNKDGRRKPGCGGIWLDEIEPLDYNKYIASNPINVPEIE